MNKEILKKSLVCINCSNAPCKFGCPLGNDIPKFIKYVKVENYQKAYFELSKTTLLPSICGRICPKDIQCERMCFKVLNKNHVKIGDIESFIGDYARKNNLKIYSPKKTKYNVLVIGSGPSSLSCAGFLRRNGIGVTIIEKHDYLGGLLVHGIPEFRLSKKLIKEVIDNIINLGIDVIYNKEFGVDFKLDDVINKYDAIYIGCGANISNKLNIEGENLTNVLGGNELLESNSYSDIKNKNVIIIGSGNTAMDVARTLKRQNNKVTIIYRKDESHMSASPTEYNDTKKDDIKFIFNTNILKIIGNDKVEKIEVIKTKFIKDQSGEEKLINIDNSNYFIKCDYLIKAIGSHADLKITNNINLDLDNNGLIDIDGKGQTSNEKVFAGGDIAGVKRTVAWASRSGRNAAFKIIEFLKES
ncbi:MAG: FAD-dependent oxidoreductase [Bacilli bacterium]|nr:FAD-dependent oxidoreductase [Bacilli bacterium]